MGIKKQTYKNPYLSNTLQIFQSFKMIFNWTLKTQQLLQTHSNTEELNHVENS